MIVFRVGGCTPLVCLQTLMRRKHEAERAVIWARIATRKELDTPDSDLAEPLKDPGEYVPVDGYDDIRVSIRTMAMRDVLRAQEAFTSDIADDMEREDHSNKVIHRFVLDSIARLEGLEDMDGEPIALEDAATLQACGVLYALFQVGAHFQNLSHEKKKAFAS